MICFPNCKINIGLYVTNRRQDGFHNLETVFYPIAYNDILEAVPGPATTFNATGLAISGASQNNLIMQAYNLLQSRYPLEVTPLAIFLHKILPMGAGLGGGSADGAFMLQLMNQIFALKINKKELKEMALSLGSDCPFFIENRPCFARGRGENLEPLSIILERYFIQIISPELPISTAAAFKLINPKPAKTNLKLIASLPLSDWKEFVTNDFESPVFNQYPELAQIKNQLYQQGAIYASLSGSGSTVYGIFPEGGRAILRTSLHFREFYGSMKLPDECFKD